MRRVMGILNDALIVTLAAQVTTLPVIVYYFGRISLISLVTNFFILPAQPPIMTGGMATLVAGLAWEPLARGLALIPWLFLTYTTAVVRLTAAVPFASVDTGELGRVAALVYMAGLIGALLWREFRRRGWVTMSAGRAMGWAVAVALPLWLMGSVLAGAPRRQPAHLLRARRRQRGSADRHTERASCVAVGWPRGGGRIGRSVAIAAGTAAERGGCGHRSRLG